MPKERQTRAKQTTNISNVSNTRQTKQHTRWTHFKTPIHQTNGKVRRFDASTNIKTNTRTTFIELPKLGSHTHWYTKLLHFSVYRIFGRIKVAVIVGQVYRTTPNYFTFPCTAFFGRIKVAVVVGQLYRTNCNLTYGYKYKNNVRTQRTRSFATFPSVSTKRLCKVHLASTSEFPREKLNSLPYRPDHRRRKRSVWPTHKPRKFAIPTETNNLQTTRNLRRLPQSHLPHTCE